jgi:hypothetical protein
MKAVAREERTGSYRVLGMPEVGRKGSEFSLFSSVHFLHAAGNLLPPALGLVLQPKQKRGHGPPIRLGKTGEPLFEIQFSGSCHILEN